MLMDKMYTNCSRLVIWLGDATPSEIERSVEAFEAFACIRSRRHPYCNLTAETNPEAFGALKAFFDLLWFKRRWVVQEVLCSQRNSPWRTKPSFMLLGHRIIPLIQVVQAFEELQMSATTLKTCTTYLPKFLTYKRATTILLQRLQECDDMQCSDERDFAYSLVNIAISDEARLPVDYSASVTAVYTTFATYLLNFFPVQQVLACTTSRRPYLQTVDIVPSWVPDWRTPYAYMSAVHRRVVEPPVDRASLSTLSHKAYINVRIGQFLKSILAFEVRQVDFDLNKISNLIREYKHHHEQHNMLAASNAAMDNAGCQCASDLSDMDAEIEPLMAQFREPLVYSKQSTEICCATNLSSIVEDVGHAVGFAPSCYSIDYPTTLRFLCFFQTLRKPRVDRSTRFFLLLRAWKELGQWDRPEIPDELIERGITSIYELESWVELKPAQDDTLSRLSVGSKR
jgi:hypothetical protein